MGEGRAGWGRAVTGLRLREARRGDEMAVAEIHVRSWQEAYRGLMPAEFLDGYGPALIGA